MLVGKLKVENLEAIFLGMVGVGYDWFGMVSKSSKICSFSLV